MRQVQTFDLMMTPEKKNHHLLISEERSQGAALRPRPTSDSSLISQWPIFPTGIIKTSSRYLYTYTHLLHSASSSSPSHLSPNSP
ncbi:hypothetical protein EYF80_010228 [Liparis tanakae]|uniref:Uncharacterized protein n=1 Tax=Liparis tanakae TaxID=230148 RepID=A0A4Z2IP58_9TELE|nr:hypothetical protein EYF80_010228 [Liparis tanakae]